MYVTDNAGLVCSRRGGIIGVSSLSVTTLLTHLTPYCLAISKLLDFFVISKITVL